ncbi:MAG TPA: serine acetyltransferase [Phycisphaerales bacterium]|nr:serine acetyltransferase [Phycisphaerales bacterium]
MFERIRHDFNVYGRSWRHRALWAMALYRFGQWGERQRLQPLRWLLGKIYGFCAVFAPIITGVAIDRAMKIGEKFHIVHPGMVVIHPGAVFGDRCGIMHNVTIGQNMNSGVPVFGNDVFIGAGAVVLGDIRIGDGACIASNSLVISDVPVNAMAMGVPAKVYPNMGMYRSAVVGSLPSATPAAGEANDVSRKAAS